MTVGVDRTAAARAAAARPRAEGTPGAGLDAQALMALVDPAFLAEAGWDPQRMVLSPSADHPLLGRPVCRVPECGQNARNPQLVCQGCQQRLAKYGLGLDQLEVLPDKLRNRPRNCAVPGCQREWASADPRLCYSHRKQRRGRLMLPLEQFITHPEVRALPVCDPCLVPACTRQCRWARGSYCNAHAQKWWSARKADPACDEATWRVEASDPPRRGETSLRGLHPVVVAQLLLGVQERTRTGRKHIEEHLRAAVLEVRGQRVSSILDVDTSVFATKTTISLVHSLVAHLRRFFVDPETEKDKDIWDLIAFGTTGTAWFTSISQRWLREATKRWAVDDLPRRRGRKIGADLGLRIRCVARLSQSLSLRADRGEAPGVLGRADIENSSTGSPTSRRRGSCRSTPGAGSAWRSEKSSTGSGPWG